MNTKGSPQFTPGSLAPTDGALVLADWDAAVEYAQASTDLLLGLLHAQPRSAQTTQRYLAHLRARHDDRLPRHCQPWAKRLRQRDSELLADLLNAAG